MKIREHCVGPLKFEARTDEEVGFRGSAQEHALNGANTRRACTEYAHSLADFGGVFFGDKKSFGMQRVSAHRLKRSQPDVQGYVRDLSSGQQARLQDLRGEVKASGGRRDGPAFGREHRL